MIVLIGESASGKSTLQKLLVESGNFEKVVTYTTRPMRPGEINGIDYHFVSNDEFERMVEAGEFVEHNEYRDWKYGTAKKDCFGANKIIVLTPAGLRALKRSGCDVTSVYVKVDRRSRLMKLLQRGDNIEEAYRRSLSDVGQFDGVEDEVDIVLENNNFEKSPEQLMYTLFLLMEV